MFNYKLTSANFGKLSETVFSFYKRDNRYKIFIKVLSPEQLEKLNKFWKAEIKSLHERFIKFVAKLAFNVDDK